MESLGEPKRACTQTKQNKLQRESITAVVMERGREEEREGEREREP